MPVAGRALRHWWIESGLSLKEIAARLNVARNTLSRWMHGGRTPIGDQRTAIERLTGGKVPAAAWCGGYELQVTWELVSDLKRAA